MVASDHQRTPIEVRDRQREHAAKPLETIRSPLFVSVDDNLGVGAGHEAMPASFQLDAEFLKVVDLAVERDPNRFVMPCTSMANSCPFTSRFIEHH